MATDKLRTMRPERLSCTRPCLTLPDLASPYLVGGVMSAQGCCILVEEGLWAASVRPGWWPWPVDTSCRRWRALPARCPLRTARAGSAIKQCCHGSSMAGAVSGFTAKHWRQGADEYPGQGVDDQAAAAAQCSASLTRRPRGADDDFSHVKATDGRPMISRTGGAGRSHRSRYVPQSS